ARDGEEAFRRLEAAALAEVAAGPPSVIAAGGGAPCFHGGIDVMRGAGVVLALTAPLPDLLARASGSSRPLLQRPAAEIEALYQRRLPVYRQAHAPLATEGRTPAEVARAAELVLAAAEHIPAYALADASLVALGERTYPVMTAAGALPRAAELAFAALPGLTRVGLVTDDRVAPLYLDRVAGAFGAEGLTCVRAVVPAGEAAKSFAGYQALCEQLVAGGLARRSAVVALGGGVVGDLAGFAAATLFRGVACVQLPTTLLAMVDSAIGGKTGIDLGAGKNLVGAIWQPRLVLADPEVLATLPARERRAAVGELVKYALLDGDELWDLVDQVVPGLVREPVAPPPELDQVIRRCVAIKSWTVGRDERELTGERALLNLGHTVGHAIESAAGWSLLHGEAVALGLIAACRVSRTLGLADAAVEQRVVASLRRAGLDADLDPWLRQDVLDHIGVDKKRTGGRVRFITVAGAGRAAGTEIPLDELSRILRTGSPV
ncbi:MAG TPA: 3-dehydroquinate synthase, partial [Kofleriaceae bacterium]|nr:3-dehydroquinate synthase [Kofleriaceae bacterium]